MGTVSIRYAYSRGNEPGDLSGRSAHHGLTICLAAYGGLGSRWLDREASDAESIRRHQQLGLVLGRSTENHRKRQRG